MSVDRNDLTPPTEQEGLETPEMPMKCLCLAKGSPGLALVLWGLCSVLVTRSSLWWHSASPGNVGGCRGTESLDGASRDPCFQSGDFLGVLRGVDLGGGI